MSWKERLRKLREIVLFSFAKYRRGLPIVPVSSIAEQYYCEVKVDLKYKIGDIDTLEYSKRFREKVKIQRIPKALIITVNTLEARELANTLKEEIAKRKLEVWVGLAHYKAGKSRRIIREFKQKKSAAILVAVNMFDIGFDDPELEVLFIARPIRNPVTYTQIRGRVIRRPRNKYNFKEQLGFAIIVDLTGQAIHEDKVYMIET